MEFKPFPKMARLSRECIITEKLDGTNAQITIVPSLDLGEGSNGNMLSNSNAGSIGIFDGNVVFVGSRTRWITPGKLTDNYGFAGWVRDNVTELLKLGQGTHFGEWWGAGIQRTYGLTEKRFSLFNASRWKCSGEAGGVFEFVENPQTKEKTVRSGPSCCRVVPTLYRGVFSSELADRLITELAVNGSVAAPGFKNPEGIIVYHVAAGIGFKKTFDDSPKGAQS